MKIGCILPHTGVYGGVRRWIEIGNEFIKLKHEYVLYTPDGKGPTWLECNVPTKTWDELEDRTDIDILICGDAFSLAELKKATGKVKVMSIIFNLDTEFKIGALYKQYLHEGFLLGGFSSDWKNSKPLQGCSGFTAVGGVNTKVFHPMEVEKNSKFNILFYAVHRPWKRVEDIVAALKLLDQEKIHLICFESQMRDDEKWNFGGLNVERVIPKTQEDVVRLYNRADCLVTVSEAGLWRNTAAEAMACKVPVVCTKIGSVDIAVDGETALLVPTRSPKIIAEKIKMLMEDSKLKTKIASGGYKRAQELTWGKVVGELEPVFKEALRKRVTVFDQLSEHYRERFSSEAHIQRPDRKELAKILLENVKEDDKVLDVGCNIGVFSKMVLGKKAHYTGVDISALAIQNAKKMYPGVDFRVMDVFDLKFPKNAFDVVFCSDVLMHLPPELDYFDAIKELYRVTNKILLVNVWTRMAATKNLGSYQDTIPGGLDARAYSFSEITSLFKIFQLVKMVIQIVPDLGYDRTLFILTKLKPRSPFEQKLLTWLEGRNLYTSEKRQLSKHQIEERLTPVKGENAHKLLNELLVLLKDRG